MKKMIGKINEVFIGGDCEDDNEVNEDASGEDNGKDDEPERCPDWIFYKQHKKLGGSFVEFSWTGQLTILIKSGRDDQTFLIKSGRDN